MHISDKDSVVVGPIPVSVPYKVFEIGSVLPNMAKWGSPCAKFITGG